MFEPSAFHKKLKGAAMIELAIILPLLLIIMLGVLEVALFFIQDNTLNKSVRESSRYLAINIGLADCYTNIAQDVVATNMNNLFASRYNSNSPTYKAETICVKDSDGTVTSPSDITGNSCTTTSATCAAGTHLHVRVLVTYKTKMLLPGLMGFNFEPKLSATSIMRVQ